MNVLVTGGAGFIGSHLTNALLDADHDLTVLDPLVPYYDVRIKERNLELCRAAGGSRFTHVEGSITDADLVADLFSTHEFEVVFHQAAQAGVRTSVDDPKTVHEINTTGLLHLLEAAVEHDVEQFVNASSSSVYGKPDYLPYDEDHPNYPQSPYAVTKLAAEHYCRVWANVHGLSTVSFRYFTVYGPRMRPNMAISNFVSRCLHGELPIIYGDGQQTRDFTYVDDIVAANLAAIANPPEGGTVLNVGSTDNITIQALAEYVIEETGADVEPVHEAAKSAEARHTHADVSKAEAVLDYDPRIDIRDGVTRFIDWYRENEDWYDPLVRES
jgi:UDP-glucose 4-epimerase